MLSSYFDILQNLLLRVVERRRLTYTIYHTKIQNSLKFCILCQKSFQLSFFFFHLYSPKLTQKNRWQCIFKSYRQILKKCLEIAEEPHFQEKDNNHSIISIITLEQLEVQPGDSDRFRIDRINFPRLQLFRFIIY